MCVSPVNYALWRQSVPVTSGARSSGVGCLSPSRDGTSYVDWSTIHLPNTVPHMAANTVEAYINSQFMVTRGGVGHEGDPCNLFPNGSLCSRHTLLTEFILLPRFKTKCKHLLWAPLQCNRGGPQCGVPPTGCLNRAGPLLRDSSLSA